MIDLSVKQQIILYHIDGMSNRAIARKLHISKDTVNKYVNDYDQQKADLMAADPEMDVTEVIQAFVEKPSYDTSSRGPRHSTEEAARIIEQCLEENAVKRATGRQKQQMKKIDIHEHLLDLGFDISYSTVKRLVSEIEKTRKEAFIRQEYDYGDICEFDWGEVKLDIGGSGYRNYQMAVFTAAKTNHRFAKLYRCQDTTAFQESHAEYFKYCRGVFHTMVYDNMWVAIKKFVGPREKEPTEGLLQLSVYYGFSFRFCNIRSGNEKGHVERSVEYVRRKTFSKPGCDSFDTLEKANEFLRKKCDELNARDTTGRFEEEQEHLLPVGPKFEACRKAPGHVDKYSTVTIERNHYSVPDDLVGREVEVRIYTDRIAIYHDRQVVARHERVFGKDTWQIDIYHYLWTLKKKPGALPKSTALLRADTRIKKIFETYYSNDARTFLEVLEIIQEKGIDAVESAIMRLARLSPKDISADKVRELCNKAEKEAANVSPVGTDHLSEISQQTLGQYDRLRQLQNEERMAG